MLKARYIPLLLLLSSGSCLYAAESTSAFMLPDFDATSGFDASSEMEPEEVKKADPTSPWRNTLAYDSGWKASTGSLSVNRLSWRIQWEGLVGKDNYLVLDSKARLFAEDDQQNSLSSGSESELKLNALYLQKSLTSSSLRVGYQVISLGMMDMLGFNNVLTPLDYSEADFTAPEDARIGQAIIAWSYFAKQGQWDLYFNPAPDRNSYLAGTEENLCAGSCTIQNGLPNAFEQTETVLRRSWVEGLHEHQWLLASLLQNDPTLVLVDPMASQQIFSATYPRYNMLAYGHSYTSGNHQLKQELALKQGIQPLDALGMKLDQAELILGWEYSANGAYTLAIEIEYQDRRFIEHVPASIEKSLNQTAVSLTKSYLHDSLKATIYSSYASLGEITTTAMSFNYSPRDNWHINLTITETESKANGIAVIPSNTSLRLSYIW